MKLIIDIPDEDYKFIKDLQSLIIGGRGNCKTIQKNVINAIRNGTPYNPSGESISREALREDLRRFFPTEVLEGIEPKTLFAQIMHDIDNAETVVTNCENCPFKKFSEDLTDKLAKVMADNGITDFDEFAKACCVSYLHQDSITKSDTEI